MMENYDESVEINRNSNWPYIPYHPHRISIIGVSRSGKTIVLLNLIKHQWLDLFICQRSIGIKVSITGQQKRKSSN